MSIDFLPNRAKTPSQIAADRATVERRARLFNPPNRILPLQVAEPDDPKPDAAPVSEPSISKPIFGTVLSLASVPRPLKWRHIVDEVIRKHAVSFDLMIGETRRKDVYLARWELFARLYDETGMSLPQIGRLLHKDHSTVFCGIKRYHEMREAGK